MAVEPRTQTWRLNADQEFRFEVSAAETCLLTVRASPRSVALCWVALSGRAVADDANVGS